MLNKTNMKKWVAELRSGKYQQGTELLNKDGKYCCLGVACEIAIENGLEVERDLDSVGAVTYDGEAGELPNSVAIWFGFRSEEEIDGEVVCLEHNVGDPNDPYIRTGVSAAHANDTLGWNFEQIADEIEKYYKLNED